MQQIKACANFKRNRNSVQQKHKESVLLLKVKNARRQLSIFSKTHYKRWRRKELKLTKELRVHLSSCNFQSSSHLNPCLQQLPHHLPPLPPPPLHHLLLHHPLHPPHLHLLLLLHPHPPHLLRPPPPPPLHSLRRLLLLQYL